MAHHQQVNIVDMLAQTWKPHPTPLNPIAEGALQLPSGSLLITRPVPTRPVSINPTFKIVRNTNPCAFCCIDNKQVLSEYIKYFDEERIQMAPVECGEVSYRPLLTNYPPSNSGGSMQLFLFHYPKSRIPVGWNICKWSAKEVVTKL